jgi:hypothetical protein
VSYSNGPGFGSAQVVGCFALGLIGCVVVAFLLVGAAMGDCAPRADGTGCENDGLVRFLMFPGSPILLIAIGIFAARRMMKDRD